MSSKKIWLCFWLGFIFNQIAAKPYSYSLSLNRNKETIYIKTQSDFENYSGNTFPAGTKILFEAGAKFYGTFRVLGSGTINNPNYIGVYNPQNNKTIGTKGIKRSLIAGMGKTTAPIEIYNGSNWVVENLEITNSNGTTDNQGSIYGLHIIAENIGIVSNISIRNCFIHNVNGNVGGKETGGIRVDVLGDTKISKFENLLIEKNRIENVGGVGISNQSSWGGINSDNYHPWDNVRIRKNEIKNTGRNGIILRYAHNPYIEFNIVANSSLYDSGHSIFSFNTTDCVIQFNEVYGNHGRHPNEIDHGAFDADYNSIGTIIQYNYSHDNDWFCGIMRKGINRNIVIRNNLSVNDKLGVFFYGFPDKNEVENVSIHNNTVVNYISKNPSVFISNNKIRTPIQTVLRDNVFYFKNGGTLGTIPDSSCDYEQNYFANVQPKGFNQDGQIETLLLELNSDYYNLSSLNAFQRKTLRQIKKPNNLMDNIKSIFRSLIQNRQQFRKVNRKFEFQQPKEVS